MKTITQNTVSENRPAKNKMLIITCCMLICIAAGWVLGSTTANAFYQSEKKKMISTEKSNEIMLPSVALNGEALPTILLSEFSVCSK